jgi:hypothetical protein
MISGIFNTHYLMNFYIRMRKNFSRSEPSDAINLEDLVDACTGRQLVPTITEG